MNFSIRGLLFACALVAACGDNITPDASSTSRTATTIGAAVHSTSAHFTLTASLRSGGSSTSATMHRTGSVEGAAQ